MALKVALVQEKPDLACLGVVRDVGEPRETERGRYWMLPIEIQSPQAPDGTFFFLFQPRWFRSDFDPQLLREEDQQIQEEAKRLGETPPGSQYGMYCRYIAYERQPAALQILAGEDFNKLAAAFDQIPPDQVTPDLIREVLRESLVGKEVGYILRQRRDRDGQLTDFYGVDRLFPAQDYKRYEQPSSRRRRPLIVTWLDEEA